MIIQSLQGDDERLAVLEDIETRVSLIEKIICKRQGFEDRANDPAATGPLNPEAPDLNKNTACVTAGTE